jgi:glutathione S-transferase
MAAVVLHQFPPMGGMPSLSPFCTKVQLALRAKRIPFEVANTMFAGRVSPTGKLPYLVWEGQGVADSSAILRVLDARAPGTPSLYPADPRAASEVHLLEDWADGSLYWQGVNAKFRDDAVWSRYRPEFAAAFPRALAWLAPTVARRQTLGKLEAQGLGRRPVAEVDAELDRHLDALAVRLSSSGSHLCGSSLTAADLAVVAMLAQLTTGYTPGPEARIRARPSVAAFLAGVLEETGTSLRSFSG